MNSRKQIEVGISIADYCLENIGRQFDGISHGKIDLPKDPSEKRARPDYLDEFGNKRKKKELADELGISESSITRLYADFYFDHIAIYEHLKNKNLRTSQTHTALVNRKKSSEPSIFRFENGEQTNSVILSKHYGVSRQFTSRIYKKYGEDYLLANQIIKAHGEKLKKRRI